MMKKWFLPVCVWGAFLFQAVAQINYENPVRLNDGWEHVRGDMGNIWETVRPNKGSEAAPRWQKVTLPHCFNAEDAVNPDVNYYQGPGWYKTKLDVNNPHPGGRTLLHFEGTGQKTKVYVHTEQVGEHVGGYDEWTVDITDALARFLASKDAARFKGKVPLSIRCDNTRDAEMIPSNLSDFNLYGGLYRYLNLVYVPAVSISRVQTDASVDTGGKEGKLSISADFVVPKAYQGDASATIKVLDPAGKPVREETRTLSKNGPADLLNVTIPNPQLWSPDEPNLYSCEITVKSKSGDMTCKEKFGFRHIEFVENGPFKLNGKRLLLRGTHRHEDHAGTAAAMTEDMIVKELEMIKAMGANFIRLGHYQQSRLVLELCDKLGILVWEEVPWCRGGVGGPVYREQGKRMLTNMITQHRNHPSVILWGMGNENDWPNDFPEFDRKEIRGYMKELNDLSHQLDPTRLTSIRRCDFCKDIIDVYSPSIWAGWYSQLYTDYRKMSQAQKEKVKRFLHVEWGGDSQAGRHAEYDYSAIDGKTGGELEAACKSIASKTKNAKDNSETYICDLVDWHLKEQENMDWLTGAAYWPFKDFSTPIRFDGPVPYMNQKGVVARDLTPKEPFYVFQSYWAKEPMVRIYGHTWPERWGKKGEEKLIKVYSNCDEVELFLNGKSLGTKKRNSQDFPAAGLRWKAAFNEGSNTLKAVGKKDGRTITDEIAFQYTTAPFGKEEAIKLAVRDIDGDYAWVEATLVDKDGRTSLDSRKTVTFDATGDGELLVNLGTPDGSQKVEACNGRARVKVRKNGGETNVSVKSKGLKTAFTTVK